VNGKEVVTKQSCRLSRMKRTSLYENNFWNYLVSVAYSLYVIFQIAIETQDILKYTSAVK
jgi:hypothetical protein